MLTAGEKGYVKMQPKSRAHTRGRNRRPNRVVGMFMGKKGRKVVVYDAKIAGGGCRKTAPSLLM